MHPLFLPIEEFFRDDYIAQRMLYLGGVETNIDTQARYNAYRDSQKKAFLRYHKNNVFHLDYIYESAYRLASSCMFDRVEPKHQVFATNNKMAAGILAGRMPKGFRFPTS